MNLLGYLRVSTDEQVRNGGGLDIQQAQIEAWCRSNGHAVTAWHSDEGVSGSIEAREGLLGVLDGLDEADGVVAQADTRFGRTLTTQEGFFAAVWQQGKAIFTTQVGEILEDDPDDPMRKAMRQFRGIMSELEAGLIRKRLRDGLRHAQSQGFHVTGPAPFGWRIVDRVLVPHSTEQKHLREIKRMRFEDGASLTVIVNYLNSNRVKTRQGNTGTWMISHVKRLLPPDVHPYDRQLHPNWLQPDKNGDHLDVLAP